MLYGAVSSQSPPAVAEIAAKFRAMLKNILIPRPPALFSRLPVTGVRVKQLIIPLASDWRVRLPLDECGTACSFYLTNTTIVLDGEQMMDARLPAGAVAKPSSYKYGTINVRGVSLRVFLETGVSQGVSHGRSLAPPGSGVSKECTECAPRHVQNTFLTLWGRSRDTPRRRRPV